MVLVVLGVLVCDAFLVWRCWRSLQALAEVEAALTRTRQWLADCEGSQPLEPLVQRLLPSAEDLMDARTERERRAVRNQLTLEIQGWVNRGQLAFRLGWRACVAAGMAGALALVTTRLEAALLVIALSGAAASVCWKFGRSADSRKAAVRDRWKTLMASVAGSFSA